jgi:hypothetical protein
MINIKKLASPVVAIVVAMSSATMAYAKADLYFMHNGSPYFIWSDRDKCVNDMRNNSNKCVTIRVCGHGFASTKATLNLANDKYNRNEKVVVKGRYNNAAFCEYKK